MLDFVVYVLYIEKVLIGVNMVGTTNSGFSFSLSPNAGRLATMGCSAFNLQAGCVEWFPHDNNFPAWKSVMILRPGLNK